jgi:hypothetical protein
MFEFTLELDFLSFWCPQLGIDGVLRSPLRNSNGGGSYLTRVPTCHTALPEPSR